MEVCLAFYDASIGLAHGFSVRRLYQCTEQRKIRLSQASLRCTEILYTTPTNARRDWARILPTHRMQDFVVTNFVVTKFVVTSFVVTNFVVKNFVVVLLV